MKINAYAKVNMILNVLGTLPNGYHEVEMLMHAISLCDVVTVEFSEPKADETEGESTGEQKKPGRKSFPENNLSGVLGPGNFEYGISDLAYRAAMLMAESFRPDLICSALSSDGLELSAGIRGVSISVEKHIPAAAGLAGGSSDAAAVMTGLAKLWNIDKSIMQSHDNNQLLQQLLPLGAKLGSDVPFCIAAQLGCPAAIARGTGTDLEFVDPVDCAVTLYFSDRTLPNKTASVYRELRDEDCYPRYDIAAFLAADSIEDKRRLMGNHLQSAAERLMGKNLQSETGEPAEGLTQTETSAPVLCGAGPTYFTIGRTGRFRTIID